MANYTPYIWADGSQGNTPITAENLNHIENGIGSNSTDISSLDSRVTSLEGKGASVLFSQYPLQEGDNEYDLNGSVNNYDLLIIGAKFYDNYYGNMQSTVPLSWFNTTSIGNRALYMENVNAQYGFAKGSSVNKITIRFNPQTNTGKLYYGAYVLGIKL